MPLFRAVAQELLDDPEARAALEKAGPDRLLSTEEQELLVRKADMARRIGLEEKDWHWRFDGQSHTAIALARGVLSGRFQTLEAPEVTHLLEDAIEPTMVRGDPRHMFDLARQYYLSHALDILSLFAARPEFHDVMEAQARDIGMGHSEIGQDANDLMITVARNYGLGPIARLLTTLAYRLSRSGVAISSRPDVKSALSQSYNPKLNPFRGLNDDWSLHHP